MDAGLGGGVPSAFTGLTYDAAGSLTSLVYPNGVVQADTVDPAGQLTSRAYVDSAGNAVASWTRTYTVHGQVANETGPSSTGSRSTAYSYDESGRLTGVSDQLGSTCTLRRYTFTSDSARAGLSAWAGAGDGTCPTASLGAETSKRTGTVNSYDQLTTTTVTGVGAGTGTYGYDALGRVTSLPGVDTPGANTTTPIALAYYPNDLAASQTQGATVRSYALDALGRLGSWVDTTGTGTTTTLNHYDNTGDSPAWTDTGTGTWTRQVTSPAGVLGIIATGTTGTATATSATVQIVNPHGDVYATIPDTASVTAAAVSGGQDLDEYGNTLTGTPQTYGWVGGKNRITDVVTGLIQMGIRLYNPMTGSFLAVDLEYAGNVTPYAYPCDPVAAFDLNGQHALYTGGGGSGVIAFAVFKLRGSGTRCGSKSPTCFKNRTTPMSEDERFWVSTAVGLAGSIVVVVCVPCDAVALFAIGASFGVAMYLLNSEEKDWKVSRVIVSGLVGGFGGLTSAGSGGSAIGRMFLNRFHSLL